jgi:hypothetical protein
MKRILAFFLTLVAGAALAQNQTYSTDWMANTFGTVTTHVGNAARALSVLPDGTLITAGMWDENSGSMVVYKGGQRIRTIGAHGESQGSSVTCDTVNCWAPRQFSSHPNLTMGCPQNNGCVFRYVLATGVNDQQFPVSDDTTERRADIIPGAANWGQFLAFSDLPGNRVRLYKKTGVLVRDIPVTNPGALAFDRNGNILVAQETAGTVLQISQTGTVLATLQLPTGEVPHALFFDSTTQLLWIGDAGPDENIKIYDTRTWTFNSSYGDIGGYLNTVTGTAGQVGGKRFTKVDGIGKDSAGNVYVLLQPWGMTWDHGRTGGTDIEAFAPNGTSLPGYPLLGLNFEATAAPDPSTDATVLYSGTNIYSGTGGADWKFVANTVDPFTYPTDPRIDPNTNSRGEHFGKVATIGSNRILVAHGQNPDSFDFSHFNLASSGYIAIPDGTLPGALFNDPAGHIRNGFCLASNGDVWAGIDKTNVITHWPLVGFDANGKPSWGAPVTYTVPATLGVLSRIIYLPESDTMILAGRITGSTDWTSVGPRIEVYHGWMAGNQSNPVVITDNNLNIHSLTAAGNYLFVGYVHTVPNIDAYNLTTGTDDLTLTNSNPNTDVGTDEDSMYGLVAVLRSNGEYVLIKDNYSDTMVTTYRWTP